LALTVYPLQVLTKILKASISLGSHGGSFAWIDAGKLIPIARGEK